MIQYLKVILHYLHITLHNSHWKVRQTLRGHCQPVDHLTFQWIRFQFHHCLFEGILRHMTQRSTFPSHPVVGDHRTAMCPAMKVILQISVDKTHLLCVRREILVHSIYFKIITQINNMHRLAPAMRPKINISVAMCGGNTLKLPYYHFSLHLLHLITISFVILCNYTPLQAATVPAHTGCHTWVVHQVRPKLPVPATTHAFWHPDPPVSAWHWRHPRPCVTPDVRGFLSGELHPGPARCSVPQPQSVPAGQLRL